MPIAMLKHLYEDYAPSMLRVTVKSKEGKLANGAGFHIGNGYVVTARHVVEDQKLEELVSGEYSPPVSIERIIYPRDSSIDLAVIKTDLDLTSYMKLVTYGNDERRNQAKTDHVPLGYHLDDWVGNEFVLSKVLLMGFPLVPQSRITNLVAVTGEVNAVVDKYTGGHPHFVISVVPRAGFSGGPVISEYGFLLGVLTEALIHNTQATELGFAAAISIEPLLVLLGENNIKPASFDDDLWSEFLSLL